MHCILQVAPWSSKADRLSLPYNLVLLIGSAYVRLAYRLIDRYVWFELNESSKHVIPGRQLYSEVILVGSNTIRTMLETSTAVSSLDMWYSCC